MSPPVAALRLEERPPAAPVCYRVGDAFLQVSSDYRPLVDALAVQYGESPLVEPGLPLLRCNATLLPGSSLLLLTFEGQPIPSFADVARRLFWTIRGFQCYVEAPCALPRWRMVVNAERAGRMLLACSDDTVVVDVDEAPNLFVVKCLLDVMSSVQPGVLFLRGASVGVHGSGALFIGPSRHGKSTTALSLSSRGHVYFGDDMAALRLPQRHLIPLRACVALRDGPLDDALGDTIEACGYALDVDPDGSSRKLVRVADLFPAANAGPVPLRFAFFLNGFADEPRLTRYEPGLYDVGRLHYVLDSHETTPGAQLMKFLEVLDALSDVQCYLLEVGPPEETAIMIEGVMS